MYKITFEYTKESNTVLPKGYIKKIKALNKEDTENILKLHSIDKWKLISIEKYSIRYLNRKDKIAT